MPKTKCGRCEGTGWTDTLSGRCACDTCCGRGYSGEDDAEVARIQKEAEAGAQKVADAARAAIAHFAGPEVAAKAVRVLKRQQLLVSKLPC